MTVPEQIKAFDQALVALIDRYRAEFNLPYAAAIGVLQLRAADLSREALKAEDNEDNEEFGDT